MNLVLGTLVPSPQTDDNLAGCHYDWRGIRSSVLVSGLRYLTTWTSFTRHLLTSPRRMTDKLLCASNGVSE